MSFSTDRYYESQYIQQMSDAIERTFDDDLNGSAFKNKTSLILNGDKILAELKEKEINP